MQLEDRSSWLQALSSECRAKLLASSRVVRVRRGQTLVARGEGSTQVFLVLEGRLHVVLYSMNGREVSLRDLATGDMFGELAAIDGEDRCANIVAASDARLMTFARTDFLSAIHSSPEAADWMFGRLARQVRALTEKIFELSALNIAGRLHSELLRLGRSATGSGRLEIVPAPSHAELANRIGATREAVTREMKVLSERKIIRNKRRRLEFLDLAELQKSSREIRPVGLFWRHSPKRGRSNRKISLKGSGAVKKMVIIVAFYWLTGRSGRRPRRLGAACDGQQHDYFDLSCEEQSERILNEVDMQNAD